MWHICVFSSEGERLEELGGPGACRDRVDPEDGSWLTEEEFEELLAREPVPG
ncbi:hypothetical protein FM112_12995 [Gulosibacter sp. 10]|nr:hypothetical protein FM112_12995 [Gulosibacter sp. 10]